MFKNKQQEFKGTNLLKKLLRKLQKKIETEWVFQKKNNYCLNNLFGY